MKSGIYKITNLINNKFYIGSSKDLIFRKETHEKELRRKKHCNSYLQNAWDKYGEDNFSFQVIEEFQLPIEFSKEKIRKILKIREQYYLNTLLKANSSKEYFLNNGYNISRYAEGGDTGEPLVGDKHPNSRKISVFDLNMNFIEEIGGLRETERKYKIQGVYKSCNGKYSRCGNYIFKYSDSLDKEYVKKKRINFVYKNSLKIYKYDLNNNLLNEYSSISEASKRTGISRTIIYNDIKGKTTKMRDYIFSNKLKSL